MLMRVLAGGLFLALAALSSGCGSCHPMTTRAGCCPPPPTCCPPGGAVVPPVTPGVAGYAPAYSH